jgi:DNA-binding MarR family transcriptional regulator
MSKRKDLIDELTVAIRLFQQGADLMDDAATEAMGINRTDGRCLDVLDVNGGRMTAGELAVAAHLSPGAVTTVLDRLERAGYARRVPDQEDRRRVLVELTPLTYQRTGELYGPMGEVGNEAMKDYTDADLELLRDFLRGGWEIQQAQAARIRGRLKRGDT